MVFSYAALRQEIFQILQIFNKNLKNPSVQVETSSLMLCLRSFPCMQASR